MNRQDANVWSPQFADFELVYSRMALFGPSTPYPVQKLDCNDVVELGPVPALPSLATKPRRDVTAHQHQAVTRTTKEDTPQSSDAPCTRIQDCSLSHPAPAHKATSGALSQHQLLSGNYSFTSSTSTLVTATKHILTMDLEANSPLPDKKYDRITRNLRHTYFSVYRRLNFLVILPNIVAMIILGAQHGLLNLPPQLLSTAVATNLTVSILIRQELVINLLFIIFGKCPQWFPLRIRRLAAKIYHLGGVHSGAGIAATIWFGIYNVSVFRLTEKVMSNNLKSWVIGITMLQDVLLMGILAMSFPRCRQWNHNLFEQTHRFAGWTAVGLFWAVFFLTTVARHQLSGEPVMKLICTAPAFWLLFTSTISLILPWLRLRRVPVQAEPLSNHAIRLHFTYANTPLCAAPRVTDNPLKEWHAFAGIPEEDGVGFSVIVSKAGDWTSKMITHPPSHLWVRGILTRGVLHIAPIFKRIILVATGSGIGPCLALLQAKNIDCRVIWSTKDPLKTYQQPIMDSVLVSDPNAIVINTSQTKRPDLVQMAYNLYREVDAEAVFLISNPRLTRDFVYSLESRGIPTFAPIFDS